MTNSTKKVLLTLVCAVLLVSVSIMGTMAYMTDKETVVNTFTVGNVAITLDEAAVDVYGTPVKDADRVTANTYKLIPGHVYTKDPTIHVTKGSEECYLFVKVVDEISTAEDTATIADQLKANGWTAVTGTANVYAKAEAVDAREATADIDVAVFANFKIKNDADVSELGGKTITVDAYAVQADGFDSAAAAWTATFGSQSATGETSNDNQGE